MYAKKHLGPVLLIALAVAGICAVIGLAIDWLPESIAPEADRIDNLMWFLYWASVFFFSIVVAVIVYCVWKFRRKPGDDTDGPPTHGNTMLEIVWTVVPTLLLAAVAVWSIVVLNDNEANAAGQVQIHGNGEQFAWRFDYASPDDPNKGVRTGDLHVPVDTQIKLSLTASDVIHAFWVAEARVKQDTTPGITTHIRFTPTKIGTFPIICTELCGAGHGIMRSRMIVQSRADYAAWLQKALASTSAG